MTPKKRLQTILDGEIPDAPPHWELVFDIEEEFFGIDRKPIVEAEYADDNAKEVAFWRHKQEVYRRLVDEYGWAAVPGGYKPNLVKLARETNGSNALIAGYEGYGVFWMPSGQDLMEFVVRLYERPEEMHEEARTKCDTAKDVLRGQAENGADFFVLTYDFGFNDAPFVSPAHFDEFVVPYLAELVEEAHSLGKKAILHSDGCLTEILDAIYATGIDGYQSVDPQGHMDIRDVRERYPDWILMGNVECSMLQDTVEEDIRGSVDYCMRHGGIGKRYIFSTSNCIFSGMPVDSYKCMYNRYQELIG